MTFSDIVPKDIEPIKRVLLLCSTKKSNCEIFYDLCYSICCARFSSRKIKNIVLNLADNYFYEYDLGIRKISRIIRGIELNRKATYLSYARNHFQDVLRVLKKENVSSIEKRDWLRNNIKGLTLSTASAFLISQGCINVAILDWRLLRVFGIKEGPLLNNDEYKRIENIFSIEAEKLGVSLTEYNAYQWLSKTIKPWYDFFFL